ncbi:MAG: peptidyl-prolyl cis-trans isomerase, partial [Acidobacteriota bacterium]
PIVVAFIVVLIPSFDGFGGPGGLPSDSEAAAVVGSEKISFAEFRRASENLERYYQQMFGERWSNDMVEQFGIRRQALEQLIDNRILLLEAERVGLVATDEEVQRAIVEDPALADANGNFLGRERLAEGLRRARVSEADFLEGVRQQVLIEKLDDLLRQTAYVSDAEVRRAYDDETERATIRFVKLPATELVGEVEVADPELATWYADRSAEFELPEQRVVDYLLIDTPTLRQTVEISEDELRTYYDANRDDYERDEQVRARHILIQAAAGDEAAVAAARERIQEIRARIDGGESFAAVARDASEDEGSAQRGGDLGNFGRGAMVKPFEEAAFGAEIGELVIAESNFGVHLIKVESKQPAGLQPFEDVQLAIRARLLSERVDEIAEARAQELAQQLRSLETVDAAALEAAATDEAVTLTTTEAFGRGDAVAGVGRAQGFLDAAFGMERGDVSAPVKIPRGWAVLHLTDVRQPRIPELSEVEDRVRTAVETEKAKDVARERLADARTRVVGGESFDAVAASLDLAVQESAEFNRSGSIAGLGREPAVIDAALALDAAEVGEPVAVADGAVLFEVVNRQRATDEEFAERADEIRQRTTDERLANLRRSLLELRRRDLEPTFAASISEELLPTAPSAAG